MPVYQIQTFKMPAFGTGSDTSQGELVDLIEFELSNAPKSDSIFDVLEAYHAEREREENSSVFQLVDILDELEDLRQNRKFDSIASAETDLRLAAKTARERIISYAIQFLNAGSYDTISDVLEPASSVLDRPDVKALFS